MITKSSNAPLVSFATLTIGPHTCPWKKILGWNGETLKTDSTKHFLGPGRRKQQRLNIEVLPQNTSCSSFIQQQKSVFIFIRFIDQNSALSVPRWGWPVRRLKTYKLGIGWYRLGYRWVVPRRCQRLWCRDQLNTSACPFFLSLSGWLSAAGCPHPWMSMFSLHPSHQVISCLLILCGFAFACTAVAVVSKSTPTFLLFRKKLTPATYKRQCLWRRLEYGHWTRNL